MVDVGIEDRNLADSVFILEGSRGDNGVVEDTESLGSIGKGMMSAPGKMNSDTIAKGGSTGSEGRAGGVTTSCHQFVRPGEPEAEDVGSFECALGHPIDVVLVMCPAELVVGGGLRAKQAAGLGRMGFDPFAEEGVFFGRESVTRWKGEGTVIGGENVHVEPFVGRPGDAAGAPS